VRGYLNPGIYIVLFLATVTSFGSCTKNEPVPVAAFDYSGTNEFFVPCTVQFTNQSAQSYTWEWWFGSDSSVYTLDPPGSTLANPAHLYQKPGTYTITLRAYTESRKEWATAIKIVTIKDTIR